MKASRRTRLLGLAIAGILLAAVVPLTAQAAKAATTPSGPVFGLSFGGEAVTSQQLNSEMSDAAHLGVKWIRDEIDWANTEPSPGVFNWSAYDAVVAAAHANGLKVLALLMYTPAWARSAGCYAGTCAPNPSEFAAFAQAAATRYGNSISAWEVWNEPNTTSFWWPTPNAQTYATLLEATTVAIRSVLPSAFVVSAGLAPAATAGGNIAQRQYLSQVCADGGLNSVSAVGIHPYSYPVPASFPAEWNAWYDMAASPQSEEKILAGCGQAGKPLWATEYGAPTQGPGILATLANFQSLLSVHPDHVDEQFQSSIMTGAISLARQTPGIGALFLFTDQDTGTATTTNQLSFGLRRTDGSQKPAWGAVQAALTHP